MGVARFTREINCCAEAEQSKQNASASDGIHQFRAAASVDRRWVAADRDWDAQISSVLTEQHQHTRHKQAHDQLPDREAIDPAGQTLHTVEVDPGEKHHQHDGDS